MNPFKQAVLKNIKLPSQEAMLKQLSDMPPVVRDAVLLRLERDCGIEQVKAVRELLSTNHDSVNARP